MVRLEVLGTIPSGGFAKVVMNARLSDSCEGKEMKTKRKWLWLFQIEAYWKPNTLNWTRNKFSLLKNFSKHTCGIGGCLKNNIHPTYLKFSHGKNSNYD